MLPSGCRKNVSVIEKLVKGSDGRVKILYILYENRFIVLLIVSFRTDSQNIFW